MMTWIKTYLSQILCAVAGLGVGVGGLAGIQWLVENPLPGSPAVAIPSAISAPTGRQKVLTATTKLSNLDWKLVAGPTKKANIHEAGKVFTPAPTDDDVDADLTPIGDTKSAIFTASQPGVYKVWVQGVSHGKIERGLTRVTVGQPGPEPTPTPPTPPPSPEPTDPFYTALKAAWTADTDAQKKAYRDAMEGVYRSVPTGDTTLKTVGDLDKDLVNVLRQQVPAGLAGERKAITDYLDGQLPRDSTVQLDNATRAKAAAAFGQIADYLQKLP